MKTKFCNKCQQEKSISEFHKRSKVKDGLQHWCKLCNCKARIDAYKKNPGPQKRRNKRTTQKNRKFIWDYLLKHPCAECGEDNPILLEFDHVRGDKRTEVSKMITGGFSLLSIKTEISKCDVRCVKCHRLRTAKEFGWYRHIKSSPVA